jgi:predicted glutamine amidotransferase
MCVIIVKPYGKKLPPKSILQKAWDSNSHGAGYAICHKNDTITRVQKGFMDFDAFHKALLEENVGKKDLLLMHFRLKTHGAMSPEHTHPFPISTQKEELEKLAYKCNMICAHNGIFHLAGQPNDMSDTMYYIKGWLSQMNLTAIEEVKKELNKDCGYNKLALIINGSLHMLGTWEKYQGCYYSNLHSIERYTISSFKTVPTNYRWDHNEHRRFNSYGCWEKGDY